MADKEKSPAELLQDQLMLNPKNGAKAQSQDDREKADGYCAGYMSFLNGAKTEREAVEYAVRAAKENGFVEFDPARKYAPGDKVYAVNRGKAIILAVVGEKPLGEGVHIAASHIDSPRLDLKPRPLFERGEIAYFRSHYYGGLKKYQWVTIPLSLHGVIVRRDGSKIQVRIGEEEGEPQFCVTDLLPHLGREQMKKPATDVIEGENLCLLIGSVPFQDGDVDEGVKLNIMKLLHEKYGIVESDFLSAELEAVPVFKAADIGFDRSMIGSYGQDDRVCAYPNLTAVLEAARQTPHTTAVCVLTDKEEIGSEGNTGLNSDYLRYFIADLARPYGLCGRDVLSHSQCLSADVSAAFDPLYPNVMEKRNSAFLNYGVVLNKYTGHGGKYDTNDASAEFVGMVRSILDNAGVQWQMAELGKVEAGGGGTVAKYISHMNVDTIDIGVPVLSMHSPFEVVAKYDVYTTFRAVTAFFKA